jgi:hypothetical protein
MKIKLLPQRNLFSFLAMPLLLAGPVWGATTPAIVSTVVNTSTNELTINGSNFKPAATAPTVALDNKSLLLVSSSNTTVVAKLPSGLAAGSYLLSITNSGSLTATLAVTIGAVGAPGEAATIAVGSTTTGAAGTSASVKNTGTKSAAVLSFTIPKGATGAKGATGPTGAAATVAVGTTTTEDAGTQALVTNSGTSSAAVLNFTIPQGAAGSAGLGLVFTATYQAFESKDEVTSVTNLTTANEGLLGYNAVQFVTIMPAACTVNALYASLTPNPGSSLPSVQVTLVKNSESTDFPVCEVSSSTPVACALPSEPFSVKAGDTLSYSVTVPGYGAVYESVGGYLNLSLLCK